MSAARPIFYFDLGSPYAYLAAERLPALLGDDVDWEPISLGALFKQNGRSSWAAREPGERESGIAEVQRRAAAYGLPPIRWPHPWPGHYLTAMRAATHAKRVGRGPEFALGALRHAFRDGADLSDLAAVLEAADRAGLDPDQTQAAVGDQEVKDALRQATDAAHARGVIGVPTIGVAGELFWGDDRLDDAAERLAAGAADGG